LLAYQMQSLSYLILAAIHRTALTSILGPFGPRTSLFQQEVGSLIRSFDRLRAFRTEFKRHHGFCDQ
jgi:hypothetical protein